MRYFGRLSFDEAKSERNRLKRGLPFEVAIDFDWATAYIDQDDRRDYGEVRQLALGYVGERLFALIFTRRGLRLHVISFRKANAREQKKYAQAQARP